MIQVDLAADLQRAAEAFTVPLRMGEGLNEPCLEELCAVLRACAREWAQTAAIPKAAANVLVDLFPAVESCSYLPFYQGETAQRIRDTAMTLGQLARACVAMDEDHL
jgi:hypothetical protein